MRSQAKLVLSACIVAVLVGLVPGGALPFAGCAGDGLVRADQLEDAQKELERIQQMIEQKKAELQRVLSEQASVISEINRLDSELDVLRGELSDIQGRLAEVETNIAQTKLDITEATATLEARQGLMLTRVRAMSEVGYISYLEVLLGARSFSDFLARFELLRQILASDVDLFRQVKEAKRQLEAKNVFLEEQRAELATLEDGAMARKASIEWRQRTKEGLLAELERDEAAIREEEENLEQLSQEVAEFIRQLELAKAQPGAKPVFRWPLESGTFWISSRFGSRFHPILKEWRLHTGIDLAASWGTPVMASATGTVSYAGWLGGYGKCIIIMHNGYLSTLYAHLSSILVEPDQVVAGSVTQIGRVGSTGYSTGPHLHFEIRLHGDPVNPEEYLPPR